VDGTEGGANSAASPRTVSDVKGNLLSAFTVIRPFQLAASTSKSPVSIMVRYDAIQPDKSRSSQRDHLFESSLIFDVAHSRRAQVAFDFQETPGRVPTATIAPNTMFQVRMVANFQGLPGRFVTDSLHNRHRRVTRSNDVPARAADWSVALDCFWSLFALDATPRRLRR